MDPLDEVLAGVRVRRAMVGQSLVTPPWGIAVDADDPFTLVAALAGPAWLSRPERDPVLLAQGVVAVTTGGGRLVVADDPTTPPDIVVLDADTCVHPVTGEDLSDHDLLGPHAWGDPDAPARVLVGSYRAGGERFATLAGELPALLLVDDDPVATSALAAAAAETRRAGPGQQVVLDRLMELLLFATVRAWLASAARPPSWYRAISDPHVGPAVQAIHDDPARRWTVAELAAVTARSRAGFARRFREVVGEPPMTYVTRWRLACAADLLADGASVGAAARAVGYADPFAFSTAFRRHHHRPPSAHRAAVDP